jgi:hypothetical protein
MSFVCEILYKGGCPVRKQHCGKFGPLPVPPAHRRVDCSHYHLQEKENDKKFDSSAGIRALNYTLDLKLKVAKHKVR